MKLIAVGSSIEGVAALVAVAIWQEHPRGGFLQAPGWSAIVAFLLGLLLTIVGLGTKERDDPSRSMTQSAGDHSVQYQAGGDIRHTGRENEDG